MGIVRYFAPHSSPIQFPRAITQVDLVGGMVVVRVLFSLFIIGLLGLGQPVAVAASSPHKPLLLMAEDQANFPIKPSQAALIARNAHPGSKVLSVRLLPSGVYAVTLKLGGSVQDVMVSATSGAIS